MNCVLPPFFGVILPFNIDALYNSYRYKMLAYREWLSLYREGKLSNIQSQFFKPKKSESLFNIEEDPHEINDLSQNKEHKEILLEMREELTNKVSNLPDLSFFPETFLLKNAQLNPIEFGQENRNEIAELISIADLNLYEFEKVKEKIGLVLSDKNPWKRYWGLIVCSSFGKDAINFLPQIKNILKNDKVNLVRIRAAEYLMLNQLPFNLNVINEILENANSAVEANLMLNTLSLIKAYYPDIELNFSKTIFPKEWYDKEKDLINRRIEFLTY